MIHFENPDLKSEIELLEKEISNPDFWNDQKNSTKILQKVKNYKDKKIIQIINSVLFCEGCKELCFFLINELLNKILVSNTDELFNKIYSTNDIFELYKEQFNLTDENDIAMQIKCIKTFITVIQI